MKPNDTPAKRMIPLVTLLAALWALPLMAQTQSGKAVVRSVKGTASYTVAGGTLMPLTAGTVLQPGSTIKTGAGSTVDLFLGTSAGLVRVVENSTLALDKLTLTDTGADIVVEVQLNVPEGTMLFNAGKMSAASKYEIKVPNGVAGIRGTKGRASSNSYIVLLDGTLIFVHVPAGGTPTPFTLVAPPPVYFSPLEGVKPAPEDLIREVTLQFAGQFPDLPLKVGGAVPGGTETEPIIFVAPVIPPLTPSTPN